MFDTSLKMICFRDIYADSQEDTPLPAEYALQFLYRDLTSDADIIGPYFLAAKTMDSKSLCPCVHDTLQLFESYRLRVRALVLDGASYNMSLVQYLCDRTFGAKGSLEEPSAYFRNPVTGDPVFVIICPSHLLKNCINAIFSSQEGGTKRLSTPGGPLNWKVIEDMWDREVQRMRCSQIRKVPGMLKSYIERDAWTKLNVKPAKIMVQDAVIAELASHAVTMSDNAEQKIENESMVQFLKALNLMFEHGFLSHTPCFSADDEACANIRKGFEYFVRWREFLQIETDFRPTSPIERRFISWQTFVLLRISVNGFLGVVRYMTTKLPAYYVAPLKLNGSAIESMFSRLKYQAGGKLTSMNYGAMRDSLVVMERSRPVQNRRDQFKYRDQGLHYVSGDT